MVLTDEIRLYGTVFSSPLNRPGIFRVTPSWSMLIFDRKILFPEVRRDAVNVSIVFLIIDLDAYICQRKPNFA